MNIIQLQYFSKVFETCNYTTAATRLFVSRQALRKSVKRLEAELRQPLFLATDNKLRPTDFAQFLHTAIQPTLSEFVGLQTVLNSELPAEETLLRLGVSLGMYRSLDSDFVVEEIVKMQTYGPNEQVESFDRAIQRLVLERELDFGCVFADYDDVADFDYICMQTHPLFLVVNPTNPLCEKAALVLADLKDQRFITGGPEFNYHHYLIKRCQAEGFDPQIELTIHDWTTTESFIESSSNVALGLYMFPEKLKGAALRLIPFADKTMQWHAFAIKPKGIQLTGSHLSFWKECRKTGEIFGK